MEGVQKRKKKKFVKCHWVFQGSTEKFEFPAKIVEYCWKRKLTGLSNLLLGAQKQKKKKFVKWHWVFQGSTGNCHTCLKKPGLLHTMGEPRCPVTGYSIGPEGSTNYISPRIMLILVHICVLKLERPCFFIMILITAEPTKLEPILAK